MLKTNHILVAGVSSAGKSTFIADCLIPALEAAGQKHQTFFAGRLMRQHKARGGSMGRYPPLDLADGTVGIVHFNLLMPYQANVNVGSVDWRKDDIFQMLTACTSRYDLYLCSAPDAVIRVRIAKRTEIEPRLSPDARPYPAERLQAQFSRSDQTQLLRSFGQAIAPFTTSRTIVHSNEHATSHLTWSEFLSAHPSPASA